MKVKIGLMSIMLLVLMLAMAGTASAATVNLVEKNPSDWSTVPNGNYGTLTYSIDASRMLTYNFVVVNGAGLTGDHVLVVIAPEWGGTSGWPQTGSMTLTGLSGTADISGLLDYVDDGADYDSSVYGAKIWYVPTADFDGNEFTAWNPGNILFEDNLITPSEARFELAEVPESVTATLWCSVCADSTITFQLTEDGNPVVDYQGNVIPLTTLSCTSGTSNSTIIHTDQTPNDIHKDWWLYNCRGSNQLLNYVHIEKTIALPHWEVLTPYEEYEPLCRCCVCEGAAGDPCICRCAMDRTDCEDNLGGVWRSEDCYPGEPCPDLYCDEDAEHCIPEFSTIALPVASILGLLFFFNYRKRKREQ